MMACLNRVQIIGYLGTDPEIRQSQQSDKIANLRVATTETWTDKQTGEKRQRTEWHTVIVFNKPLAKFAESFLKKGSQVYVEGEIHTRKWTDKGNVDHYTTEIILPDFRGDLQILDRKGSGGPPPGEGSDGGEV
ncbi:MAG: single-stranded DNA-binding protein [Rhodospirillum sp.]|nr:single-stranded DNA-binding protein [Rhodospirillum sp.]MCF8501776.1 single-stranded DNA-binding protein [Rhodospirillum sp.]